MHTVERLEQALAAATGVGYQVRRQWFGGTGGYCEIRGQKWLFLDETATPAEHLELVLEALRHETATTPEPLPVETRPLMPAKRAA